MRGGLSTRDHDYGIFNNIHHDIGTHVVHHLFPQVGSLGSFVLRSNFLFLLKPLPLTGIVFGTMLPY